MSTPAQDKLFYRNELAAALGVSTETLRRWIRAEKIPKPDIDMSRKTQAWRLSSLQAAGVGLL